MTNQTVYVVTSGSYSDYSIRAIFSTREKAQAYINALEKAYGSESYTFGEINGINEWVLDELEFGDNKNHEFYVCSKENSIEVSSIYDYGVSNPTRTENINKVSLLPNAGQYGVNVIAPDFDTAKKIAADLFRQYKALNQ